MRRSRSALAWAFAAAVVLHAIAALATWESFGTLGRGGVLIWLDFPISLLYLHLAGSSLFFASLAAGGLQWGVFAALLAYWLGSTLRGRRPR